MLVNPSDVAEKEGPFGSAPRCSRVRGRREGSRFRVCSGFRAPCVGCRDLPDLCLDVLGSEAARVPEPHPGGGRGGVRPRHLISRGIRGNFECISRVQCPVLASTERYHGTESTLEMAEPHLGRGLGGVRPRHLPRAVRFNATQITTSNTERL